MAAAVEMDEYSEIEAVGKAIAEIVGTKRVTVHSQRSPDKRHPARDWLAGAEYIENPDEEGRYREGSTWWTMARRGATQREAYDALIERARQGKWSEGFARGASIEQLVDAE